MTLWQSKSVRVVVVCFSVGWELNACSERPLAPQVFDTPVQAPVPAAPVQHVVFA